MKGHARFIGGLLIGVVFCCANAVLASPQDRIAEWKRFRAAHPYHVQTVALSEPDTTGKRLLIVSEPPPDISLQQIVAVSPALLTSGSVQNTTIGFDGSVSDAIFELPPVKDGELRALIENLHIRLYGTAYKAYASSISASAPAKEGLNFDLHVNAGTLARWLAMQTWEAPPFPWFQIFLLACLTLYGFKFIRSKRTTGRGLALLAGILGLAYLLGPRVIHTFMPDTDPSLLFVPLTGGEARTVTELFQAKESGVFTSQTPGLILWVVPRHESFDAQRRQARWFAVDSDILLGAVADDHFVAIVGRERVVPVELLPPLRAETMTLLASVQGDELAQSYERNHLFAGPTGQGWDWAPIYLSDALIDTEYGSLLNITDQLLKSWSAHGEIEYVHFAYPKPDVFPFPKPLMQFAKVTRVTYNWNTKGAGYSEQVRGFDFFAWNRTGALPVDYLGGSNSELHAAEQTGYDYFAGRSDPNLVRVVQYAQLYQIFRHYGIKAPTRKYGFHLDVPPEYRESILRMLKKFMSLDDSDIDLALLDADDAKKVYRLKTALDGFTGDGQALRELADAIAGPRQYREKSVVGERSDMMLSLAQLCADPSLGLNYLAGLSPQEAMEAYVRFMKRPAKGWIHTPSIVLSYGTGYSAQTTGGHNLDATITRFRVSSELKSGEVRIVEENGSRVILHNQADADLIGETVRAAAREDGSAEEIESRVQTILRDAKPDSRPLRDALGFTAAHEPDASRGLSSAHVSSAINETGWRLKNVSITDQQTALLRTLDADGSHAIVIERGRQGGYTLFDGPSRRIVQADNQPAAIDALLAYTGSENTTGPVRLHMRGFEPRAASNFTKSTELQLAGFGSKRDILATLDAAEVDAEQLKGLLLERYNFQQVTIKEISAPFMTAEGEMALHVDAEVMALKSTEPLHVRFLVALRRGLELTANLIAQIRTTILTAFGRGALNEAQDGTLLLTGKILEDLNRISPDVSYVHAKVMGRNIKDLYIVKKENDSVVQLSVG